jgi:mono/diheme cytochrome c family protein
MSHFFTLSRFRQLFTLLLITGSITAAGWHFVPGLPVLWGPSASADDIAAGRELFIHEWTPDDPLASGDGLGPVFNARSCVACHFQGGVGGGGTNQHNVAAFEVMPDSAHPQVRGGVIHASAVDPSFQENMERLQKVHPVIKGSTQRVGDPHCPYTIVIPDFNPVTTSTVNTTALFGVGWIDRISTRTIQANHFALSVSGSIQEFKLDFNSIPVGRYRVLSDGRIGKFGWKAQFATLREFVAAACANEIGLSNPLMGQPTPISRPDYQAPSETDLDHKQFAQLVAFVDTLPRPVEAIPDSPSARARAERGKQVFSGIGCAVCHTPDIGGVPGVYSDFLLHSVEQTSPSGESGYDERSGPPQGTLPVPTEHPRPSEWKTPPLWGVADSAPYFHDGGARTLQDAILRHGRDAASVTEAYRKLPGADQAALLAFLNTLKAPKEASQEELLASR